MHIASMVIRTRPEDIRGIETSLNAMTGVDVHAVTTDGRLVVTIEGADRSICGERLMAIHAIPRLLSAGLVYEQSDEAITETTP